MADFALPESLKLISLKICVIENYKIVDLTKFFSQCGNFIIFLSLRFLREINLWDSGSAKSAILTYLEALNFGFYEFLHFLSMQFTKLTQFRALKMAKTAV